MWCGHMLIINTYLHMDGSCKYLDITLHPNTILKKEAYYPFVSSEVLYILSITMTSFPLN